jgi:filamentous hemagglutinin
VEGAGATFRPYSGNPTAPDFVGPLLPATGAPAGPVINAAGAARAAKYNAFQQGVSLNDTVSSIAGDNPVVSYTVSGKTLYANPSTGMQVVYDNAGNYFRIENTNVTGPLRYTDQFGNPIPANVPLVKPSGTTQTGVPSDVRNALTHFTNTDGKP